MRRRKLHIVVLLVSGIFSGLIRGQERDTGSEPRRVVVPSHFQEIDVDEGCRIYEAAPHSDGKKEHVYTDRGICDVGDVQVSDREETDFDDGKLKHGRVTIQEHTFTLHNPYPETVVFVLRQGVTKGWQIDSDPQPNRMDGAVATFLVNVEPGQTVSLHVGERKPPK